MLRLQKSARGPENTALKAPASKNLCNSWVIMVKQGKYEQAITHFTGALHINPNLKGARENLAEARVASDH